MKVFLLSLILGLLVPPLSAELTIESAHWQLAQMVPGQGFVFRDISFLSTVPPRVVGRLHARLILKNRGPAEADGILLRYCLCARLAPLKGEEEGVWAIPFMIEEKRVPKIGPNQHFEVLLDPSRSMDLPFTRYLQKVYRSGFWPDQLKLQVMLSPHRGAVETIGTKEIILPIKK